MNNESPSDYKEVPDNSPTYGSYLFHNSKKFSFWEDRMKISQSWNCDLIFLIVKPIIIDEIDKFVVDIRKKYSEEKIVIMINIFGSEFQMKKRKTLIGELDEIIIDFKKIENDSGIKEKIMKYIYDEIYPPSLPPPPMTVDELIKTIDKFDKDKIETKDLELLSQKLLTFRDDVIKRIK